MQSSKLSGVMSMVALCVLLLLAGCLHAPRDADHVAVARIDGQVLTLPEMEHAIRYAVTKEQWDQLEQVAPGHYVATRILDPGKIYASVDIFYTAADFSVHYKASAGLRYDPRQHVIGSRYQDMVEALVERIRDVADETGIPMQP